MMSVLVVTSEPIAADELREAIGTAAADDVEVMVVAPALHKTALRFWVSDADEAIDRAEFVAERTVGQLLSEGIPAKGDTGEADIVDAVGDALTSFAPDRILLFTHPPGHERYREDVGPGDLAQFGIPVDRFEAQAARR
jgi:hypothetical protein